MHMDGVGETQGSIKLYGMFGMFGSSIFLGPVYVWGMCICIASCAEPLLCCGAT